MKNSIFTSVKCYKNKIYYRGYDVDSGKRIQGKLDYCPTLFLETEDDTGYTSIYDKNMMPHNFDNIEAAKLFYQTYKDKYGTGKVFGMDSYEYCYIADNFKGKIEFDYLKIKKLFIDIEVTSDEELGFPHASLAEQPITAITIKTNNSYITFGCGEYKPTRDDIYYFNCKNELTLLTKFLGVFKEYDPDVISGWNIVNFDIPYLINRMKRLMDESEIRKISPWSFIRKYTEKGQYNDEYETYDIVGIEILDYLALYKKIPHKNQKSESYKLDFIAQQELGKQKVDYGEYKTLSNLRNKNHQLFIEYNIEDVKIVQELEEKLSFLELTIYTTYDAKCNYSDFFQQTKMWDMIMYNHLKTKKKVIPPKKDNLLESYSGAYVKPTATGLFHWIVTEDLTSLYPHIQMQWNISPETLVELKSNIDIDSAANDINSVSTLDNELCIAGSGYHFRKDKIGILPEILQTMFRDRKESKNKMEEYENLLVEIEKELESRNV